MDSTMRWVLRGLVALGLLAVGILSLPLVAMVLDQPGQEPWIIPVQVTLMALLGAGVGALIPWLAGSDASRGRGAIAGAAIALVGVVISLVLFFLLLSGLGGL